MQPGSARFTIPAPSVEASVEGEEAGEHRLSTWSLRQIYASLACPLRLAVASNAVTREAIVLLPPGYRRSLCRPLSSSNLDL